MLRRTLITLTAIATLGVGATGGHAGGVASGGGFGGAGIATMHGGGAGPTVMPGEGMGPMTRGGPMTTEPMAEGRGWNGRTFSRNNLAWGAHDHFHRHNFFVFGVGGPSVVGPDYAAHDTCWTQFATFYGWQWFYVC